MKAATPAHVFWLGVLANLVAGMIALVFFGWWRAQTGRRFEQAVNDAAADLLHTARADGPRRRRS